MNPDVTILYDSIRWEEKALLEAGKKKNINIQMVDCKKLALDLEKKPEDYGVVIQRCVSYYRNLHSTAALEGLGVKVINCLNTGVFAGNKLFTHMLLKKIGVPTPDATVAFSKDAAIEALETHGYPKVIKPTVGSWGRLISKLNDGKIPNYIQVIPKNNQKKLEIDLNLFLNSVDRVASVSLDKKDGVKFNLTKDKLNLSVNNANSGDGKETLNVKFNHELDISFNSRYLIDVASQLDGDKIEIFLNDAGSPALIKDPADFDSIFVVMPMKG